MHIKQQMLLMEKFQLIQINLVIMIPMMNQFNIVCTFLKYFKGDNFSSIYLEPIERQTSTINQEDIPIIELDDD